MLVTLKHVKKLVKKPCKETCKETFTLQRNFCISFEVTWKDEVALVYSHAMKNKANVYWLTRSRKRNLIIKKNSSKLIKEDPFENLGIGILT